MKYPADLSYPGVKICDKKNREAAAAVFRGLLRISANG
jgi:hypothetical protein